MLITKEQIIQDINYQFNGTNSELDNLISRIEKEDEKIIESKNIIVVPDIHQIDENALDISKKIYLLNLNNYRQTSTRNYQLMFNSLRALGEKNIVTDIFKELKNKNPIYTKNFLLRENWTDLSTFFFITDLIKKYTDNPDPRSFERMGMFAGLDDETLRLIDIYEGDKAKLSLKEKMNEIMLQFASVNDVYGLAPTKNRSVNYDLLFQHITTTSKKDSHKFTNFETIYLSKYFDNFKGDISWDHEWWVNGIWRGLAARKNKRFANLETKYFFDSMDEVLKKSYSYETFDIIKTDSITGTSLINGKEISHDVVLERKEIKCKSSLTTKLLSTSFPKKRIVYDPTPIEISSLPQNELQEGLDNGTYVKITHIDEKLVDSKGRLIFEEGNMLGGPYTYSILKYSSEKIQDPDLDLFSSLSESKNIEIDLSSNKKRKIEGAKQRAELRKRFIDLMGALESERFMRENLEDLVDERTNELAKAQQELIQERTLGAIGTLAAGVAHNFKNDLNAIKELSGQLIVDAKNNFYHEHTFEKFNIDKNDLTGIINFIDTKYFSDEKITFINGGQAFKNSKIISDDCNALGIEIDRKQSIALANCGIDNGDLNNLSEYLNKYNVKDIVELLNYGYRLGSQDQGITNTVISAYKVIKNIMTFTDMAKRSDQEINLNQTIDGFFENKYSELNKLKINFKKSYQDEIQKVKIDPKIITNVIETLYSNSIYSLKKVNETKKMKIKTYTQDGNVYIKFSDTGLGIPKENQEKIFEPFFTTKDGSEGTGMGLFYAYSLVKSYGNLTVKSDNDKTTFKIQIKNTNK
jgi:signal transduction histidine kinase